MMSSLPSRSKSSRMLPPDSAVTSTPSWGATSRKCADIVVGGQGFCRNDPLRGDLGRVLPQGHVGQVEQPAKPQMAGILRQELEQEGDGSPGAPLQAMPAGFPHRKKTGVFSVGGNAVLLLPQPQIGHRQQVPDHGSGLPRQLPRLPPDPGL